MCQIIVQAAKKFNFITSTAFNNNLDREFWYKSFVYFLGSFKIDFYIRIKSRTTLQVQQELIRRLARESYVDVIYLLLW